MDHFGYVFCSIEPYFYPYSNTMLHQCHATLITVVFKCSSVSSLPFFFFFWDFFGNLGFVQFHIHFRMGICFIILTRESGILILCGLLEQTWDIKEKKSTECDDKVDCGSTILILIDWNNDKVIKEGRKVEMGTFSKYKRVRGLVCFWK